MAQHQNMLAVSRVTVVLLYLQDVETPAEDIAYACANPLDLLDKVCFVLIMISENSEL